MAYIDETDLLTRMTETELVQCTNDDGTGDVDADVLAGILTETDALVDSYVGVRHGVPIESPSNLTKDIAKSIAVYKLLSRRGLAPEHVEKNYDDAIRLLRRIGEGKAAFSDAALLQPHGSRVTGVRTEAKPRVFNDDDMEGF